MNLDTFSFSYPLAMSEIIDGYLGGIYACHNLRLVCRGMRDSIAPPPHCRARDVAIRAIERKDDELFNIAFNAGNGDSKIEVLTEAMRDDTSEHVKSLARNLYTSSTITYPFALLVLRAGNWKLYKTYEPTYRSGPEIDAALESGEYEITSKLCKTHGIAYTIEMITRAAKCSKMNLTDIIRIACDTDELATRILFEIIFSDTNIETKIGIVKSAFHAFEESDVFCFDDKQCKWHNRGGKINPVILPILEKHISKYIKNIEYNDDDNIIQTIMYAFHVFNGGDAVRIIHDAISEDDFKRLVNVDLVLEIRCHDELSVLDVWPNVSRELLESHSDARKLFIMAIRGCNTTIFSIAPDITDGFLQDPKFADDICECIVENDYEFWPSSIKAACDHGLATPATRELISDAICHGQSTRLDLLLTICDARHVKIDLGLMIDDIIYLGCNGDNTETFEVLRNWY